MFARCVAFLNARVDWKKRRIEITTLKIIVRLDERNFGYYCNLTCSCSGLLRKHVHRPEEARAQTRGSTCTDQRKKMGLVRTVLLLTVGVISVQCRHVSPPDLEPDSDANTKDPGLDDPWLADFDGGNAHGYVDYLEEMQADAPAPAASSSSDDGDKGTGRLDEWVCPPPPHPSAGNSKPPALFCRMTRCLDDAHCKGPQQKCCFNGCVRSCLNALPPPPLVDWMEEPPRRLLAGSSWLVGGPEVVSQGDSCSTDFDPAVEDALLCSQGYICHILHAGDKDKGVPNRGRCMREDSHDHAGPQNEHRFRLATSQQGDENVCVFENAIFVDGARFLYQQHECECLTNTITCTVGDDTLD